MNSNNLIKSQRNIDFEKEKHKIDSFNKEFLIGQQNENLKKLDLNSIQIHSINLFGDENKNDLNTKNSQDENNILCNNINNNAKNINLIENFELKSKEFFKMMYLFVEISKAKSPNKNNTQEKIELEYIAKKISALISNKKKYKKINNLKKDFFLNSSLDEINNNNKNDFKIKTSFGFHKSKTLRPNGQSSFFSIAAANQLDKPNEVKSSARAVNSLAKARMEKDFLKTSKNWDFNLNTYLNSLSNSNNNNINLNAPADNNNNYNNYSNSLNNNDLYPKNNFYNNLNELNILRDSYNKPFTKEGEINLNNFIENKNINKNNNSIKLSANANFNKSSNIIFNNNNNNNNLNSSLIEDLPLENPFNKAKSPNNNFAETPNCFIIGEAKSNLSFSSKINSIIGKSSKNDFSKAPYLSKIIKIQKFWRKWKIKEIIFNNEFEQAAFGVKSDIIETLGKSEKINSLLNSIYKAFNIFSSIKNDNSKGNFLLLMLFCYNFSCLN